MSPAVQQMIETFLPLIISLVSVAVGFLASGVIFFTIERLIPGKTADPALIRSFIARLKKPARMFLPALALKIVLPSLNIPPGFYSTLDHILTLWLIGSLTFLAVRGVSILKDYVLGKYQVDQRDNLQERKIQTRVKVIQRIVIVIIFLIAFSTMLMTFDKVRQLGTSILASAGIISVIIGIAAQKSIGTLIAGLQIAITQPIRLDDVVIVEGEWGKIEEITLTYVVMKIWDQRRLVLPITYFLEKPFQNWTRATSALLGAVYLYLDYTVPVEAVREELDRILRDSPLWDGRVGSVSVTDATDRTAVIRALMSVADSSAAWDLRCHVRERLINFLRENYPNALPRFRVELENDARS